MKQQVQTPPIDLKNTSKVSNSRGGQLFQQGIILRKVSRFVTGTDEDGLLPIPIFYCPATFKILESSVPKELREELKEELI